jgi:hypothetical protein
MARNDRYVRQTVDGDWVVLKEGHRRATAQASSQRDALARAKALTRREGGGEVRVMNRSGKIVHSDTVRRSRPRRSK